MSDFFDLMDIRELDRQSLYLSIILSDSLNLRGIFMGDFYYLSSDRFHEQNYFDFLANNILGDKIEIQ